MTVKKVWAVYFSGTGTTKKTVDRIAHRLAEALGTDCEVYDYTLPAARRQELTIPSGDVAVVGCPTYAGRVPNLLMPYLRDMVHGEGALAVPVVLFGNRNYDDALMELSQLLTADGFSCVAGGAFVGEHSFSRTLGAGRGDVKRKVAITLKNQGEIKNKRLSHYAESRPGKTGRLFCVVGLERRKIFLVEN